MSSTNSGGQKITFDFRDNLSNRTMNRVYTGLLDDGVYQGFDITASFGVTADVNIGAGILCIYDSLGSGTLFRIETSQTIDGTVNVSWDSVPSTTPYIVCRYTFQPLISSSRYADFYAVAEEDILSTDVILCKLIFGADYVDYNNRKIGTLKQMTDMLNGLKVVVNDSDRGHPLLVKVLAGTVMSGSLSYTFTNDTPVELDQADATNPRIDLIYIDPADFPTPTIKALTGTPAVSPVPPSYSDYIVLAEVTVQAFATPLSTTVGEEIFSEDILDIRNIFNNFLNNMNNYFVLSEIVKYPGTYTEDITYTLEGYIDVKTFYAYDGTTELGTETYTYGGTAPAGCVETITYWIKGPGTNSGRTIVKTYTYTNGYITGIAIS